VAKAKKVNGHYVRSLRATRVSPASRLYPLRPSIRLRLEPLTLSILAAY